MKHDLILPWLAICWMKSCETYSYYPQMPGNFRQLCGDVITLSCDPLSSSWGGSLALLDHHSVYHAGSCSVSFAVATISAVCGRNETYAIYLNFRFVNLGKGDEVTVTEIVNANAWIRTASDEPYQKVVKKFSRGTNPGNLTGSVAQLQTQYSDQPIVTISWDGLSSSTQLVVDYHLIRESPADPAYTYAYLYCGSLKGHVRKELYCDKSDRISCPTFYEELGYSAYNPAKGKQTDHKDLCDAWNQLRKEDVSHSIVSTCYEGPRDLNPAVIAGIAVGCLVGLMLLTAFVIWACSPRRKMMRRLAGATGTHPPSPSEVEGPSTQMSLLWSFFVVDENGEVLENGQNNIIGSAAFVQDRPPSYHQVEPPPPYDTLTSSAPKLYEEEEATLYPPPEYMVSPEV